MKDFSLSTPDSVLPDTQSTRNCHRWCFLSFFDLMFIFLISFFNFRTKLTFIRHTVCKSTIVGQINSLYEDQNSNMEALTLYYRIFTIRLPQSLVLIGIIIPYSPEYDNINY